MTIAMIAAASVYADAALRDQLLEGVCRAGLPE